MMCSGPENPPRARSALSAPMRPAHGSTVFFMLVSLPAVTAPGQKVRAALIPIAETICAGLRFKTRPAAIGAANALKVA